MKFSLLFFIHVSCINTIQVQGEALRSKIKKKTIFPYGMIGKGKRSETLYFCIIQLNWYWEPCAM